MKKNPLTFNVLGINTTDKLPANDATYGGYLLTTVY